MTFTKRYLTWLLVPPAVVTLPLAFLFLAQVVQFSTTTATLTAVFVIVLWASGAFSFYGLIAPHSKAVEKAIEGHGDISAAMSRCLEKTKSASLTLWTVGGVLFSIFGTMFVMRSVIGLVYFLVAAFVATFPAVAWGYAVGKHQLLKFAPATAETHYVGREFSLKRKIAIVFIGCFIMSAAVLVELISSKVSGTLEELAISSAGERFQYVLGDANALERIDGKSLSELRLIVPPGYTLHLVTSTGSALDPKDPLTDEEVREIRAIKTGDSTSFISPHVVRFALLRDSSILVMGVPWAPYKNIPQQITFYTLIVALFTTMLFSIATYFLARDVTTPLQELRFLARELAEGNFDAAARVFSDDEVGQLADSFGETRNNLRRLIGRVGGSGATITSGVRVITGGTQSLLTRSRNQAELTESSSMAVENVRSGVSSILGAADTVTELTQDASSRSLELQASSEEVARSMDYLFQSVEKTTASTTEMDASMREMSKRTDVLAGIGDEVLSFVSQMDSTIEELRSNSQATAEISRQVREDAQAGGAAVGRTVQGINLSRDLTNDTAMVLDNLQQSVGQISQILNVIEEITGRTNLLALNAAIIAAQAGEHGLGFTVVANEIRELADRTRSSTKEIGSIIKAVQAGSKQAVAKMHEGVARVEENVELAEDAARSLEAIFGSASNSYEMATKISRALDDQASASRHLHEVSSRMSDHIAEINRATREQARGTQLLAQESERVREIAGQVRNATDEQSTAGRGITTALEKIAEDARAMRDLLERQLHETDRIAEAARTMLDIAQANDAIAREFDVTVQNLVQSGQDFESEVSRFRITV